MKTLTFNQLQLRLFAILFLLFTSAVFGYRYFIELPKLEQTIAKLSERELETLTFSILNMKEVLARTNYDYAVWTSTYEFMRNQSEEYIDENFVDNTFISLELDGIFYLDEHLKPLYVKGLHHKTLVELPFSFYDFIKYPNNLSMLPIAITEMGAPKKSGFINTQHGPALYSVTQIRDSDLRGEARGFLIMVQLLEAPFVVDLSKYTLTTIAFQSLKKANSEALKHNWDDKIKINKVKPYTDVVIRDNSGSPVLLLKVNHSNGKLPRLIDEQSIVFIILISIFIYVAYLLVSNFIIVPVRKLAVDIKHRDSLERYAPLDEIYSVQELALVSKNVNQLMSTVQQQNDILARQVNTDSLTQIMNRRGLISAMEDYKDLCIRKKIGFITVMADIDYFKRYNDSAGHLEGDIALSEVANVLNEQCKRKGDICARYGGEEFTLLFSEMDEKSLNEKLNKIMKALQSLALAHPSSPISEYVTISMGAVIVTANDVVDFTLSLNEVFRAADRGLYQAKSAGRNRFVISHFSTENKESTVT